MKTSIISIPWRIPKKIFSPLSNIGLPLFCLGALLPAVNHLLHLDYSAAGLFSRLGPVLAGCWLAGVLPGSRLHTLILGTVITVLLLAINWTITAGGCCATMH